jgi:hypothetical protein
LFYVLRWDERGYKCRGGFASGGFPARGRAQAERRAVPNPTAAPDPPAPDPELSEKFPKKAHDLDAARKSVEDAASVSAGLWLSYLFVLLYRHRGGRRHPS